MRRVLDELCPGARVAVIRLRSLGDCVLSTPAIALLKSARPDLQIAVVVDSKWAAVYEGNPDVAAVLGPKIGALRAWRPELVLNLHGGSTSARLTGFSGARWRAGFAHFRQQFLYNIRIPRAQEILGVDRTVHTCEHAASATFWFGVTACEIPRARVFAERGPERQPYVLIHPVASEPAKTWAPEGFLAAASFFQNEANLKPVFLGAAADDLSAFGEYHTAQGQTLTETKALMAGASCFLGNDSGPAHLAAAFGVPSVVLFGPSDPAIWGPWRTEAVVLRGEPIAGISVPLVIRSVEQLLTVGRPAMGLAHVGVPA